jgi:hypothetical protein
MAPSAFLLGRPGRPRTARTPQPNLPLSRCGYWARSQIRVRKSAVMVGCAALSSVVGGTRRQEIRYETK